VIEDDYDGEFRYRGRPLQALQGLDREGRVIYVGTFSKVLFPALRLGYMVLPGDLVDAFASAHRMCMRFSPTIEQAVLADFIAEGHFARHVRRMRALYSERRAILVEAVEKRLGGLLEVDADEAGMHLVGWLPEGADAADVSREVLKRGVEAPPLSAFSLSEPQRPGLLLGYAAVPPHGIRFGVRRLAEAIEQHQSLCKQAP
jgi:GntR family transcriptional regulator/MocR family aminotransferase